MAKRTDAGDFNYAGFESSLPENSLEANHASPQGGAELAGPAGDIAGGYGGMRPATPYCGYDENHASVNAKIEKAD